METSPLMTSFVLVHILVQLSAPCRRYCRLLLRRSRSRLLLCKEGLLLLTCCTQSLQLSYDVSAESHERESISGHLLKVQKIDALLHLVKCEPNLDTVVFCAEIRDRHVLCRPNAFGLANTPLMVFVIDVHVCVPIVIPSTIQCFPTSHRNPHLSSQTLPRHVWSPPTLNAVGRQLEPLTPKSHECFVNFRHNMCRVLLTLNTQIPPAIPTSMLMLGNHSNVSRNR
mmetsp:Transcript_7683/g.16440  ORF Transcript_7683/g.16440 Transcript_7683/m.16440 type:complete len:226 (-) Transcript_7683:1569-2246(-)